MGFTKIRQSGSHVIMQRGSNGCVVPMRSEVKVGTLAGVLRQADVSPEALLQQRMDTAFGNYLQLSRTLEADMTALLYVECEDQHWRRNFIRSAVALIEGHAHCLREMCAVSFECIAPELA